MRHIPIVLSAILLAGCSGPAGPGIHAGEPFIVNSQRTPFYSYGPAQTTGPDFALYHGQRLTMLSYNFGYSHVAIQGTGQSGYVATDDVVPAPPSPSASPGAARTHHRRRGDTRPPADSGQSQIPLPEFPETEPPPNSPPFRY